MADVAAVLRELGVEPRVAEAAKAQLEGFERDARRSATRAS
jgi:hypothetical protein